MSDMLYEGTTSIDWSKASQYDLKVTLLPWHLDILPISAYNEDVGGATTNDRIATAVPALYELRADVQEIAPRAYIVNTLAGVDTPGEWASLDGKLYLYPSSSADDIFVPQLTELIRIDDGTLDGNAAVSQPVSGITFDGITFTGAEYRIIQSNDIMSQHDWMVVDEPDALLSIRNATDITVQNCTFTKSGGSGVRVDRLGQNIKIRNNTLTYLGRNGIGLLGRGPGYGDVNRSNEIAFNHLEYIGMEKWGSVAILLDNSSNNRIHRNYIANTYFTGIATVGPRQLALVALLEGAKTFYLGREFRFFEWAPSVVEFARNFDDDFAIGAREGMRFVYNYSNQIEENALIDVSTGRGFIVNGQIYVSGAQRSTSPMAIRTNFVERNYMRDTFNHSINDYAMYGDSDQDDCNYTGNMISGVKNADSSADNFPSPIILAFNQWAEDETQGLGEIKLFANLTIDSDFCSAVDCMHTIGIDFTEQGRILNKVESGSANFLPEYQRMYSSTCDANLPQVGELPSVTMVRNRLQSVITGFGGSVPNCP